VPVLIADKGRKMFATSPVMAARGVGCRSVGAIVGAVVVTVRGGVRPHARGDLLAVQGVSWASGVLFQAVARASGGRAAVRRSGMPTGPAVGRLVAVSKVGRGGGVRLRMPCRALQVSTCRASGRVSRLLESWNDLPAPWAAFVVPQVGFVGRSLAALEYLRGAVVGWDAASGAVLVGGQVVIGDDGGTVRVASVDGAAAVVARQCDSLAVVVGVAIAHRGELRQSKADRLRQSARIAVGKASRALARGGIEANRASCGKARRIG